MTSEQDPLREHAFRLLGRAMTRFDPGRLEDWVELGLTMTQLRVLFVLRNEPVNDAGQGRGRHFESLGHRAGGSAALSA